MGISNPPAPVRAVVIALLLGVPAGERAAAPVAPGAARPQVPDSGSALRLPGTALDSAIYFRSHSAPADTSPAGRRARARDKYDMGRALERAQEPAAAIIAYRTATMLDPAIADANYRMGMLFLTKNQLQIAAECFVQELKHHSENVDAARQLGLTYARLGRNQRAVLQLEPLAYAHAGDPENWAALGFAYAAAARPGAADSALRRAIALKPNVASWHRDLGVVLAGRGQLVEARREYRLAAKLDPKDATPWVNLGNLESRAARYEPALAAYRAAEARDSLSSLAMEGEVKTLRDLGRDADAGEVYRRWLARRPDDHNARLEAVRLYGDLGRDDIALEIAREGVRALPDSPDAHLVLGMALRSSGDWRDGLAEMRRAESGFSAPEDRARVRTLIGSMRGQAPDSLRAFFAADSVAHPALPEPPGRSRKDVR